MAAKRQGFSLKARAVNTSEGTPAIEPVDTAPAPASSTEDTREQIKRLTLDMPVTLHTRLKIKSMEESTTMAKMVRKWIDEQIG
jgi:hypothetical protein